MARSLTVTHEENLSVNWLFAGFLMIAVGWMTLAGIASAGVVHAEAAASDGAALAHAELQPISRK